MFKIFAVATSIASLLSTGAAFAQETGANQPDTDRYTKPATGNSKNAFPKVVVRSQSHQTATDRSVEASADGRVPDSSENAASADQHSTHASGEGNAKFIYRTVKASPNPKDNFYKIVKVSVDQSSQ